MLEFRSANGEATELTTEIETTRTQDQKFLWRTDGKLKILGSKRVKRAKTQSAFSLVCD